MPPTPTSAPPARHTAGPARTREELAILRPGLVARYDAELPGARAAVLARLLGALAREPLPGLRDRRPGEARFANGVTVRFPAGSAAPFAPGEPGLRVDVHGDDAGRREPRRLDDPAELVRLLWPRAALAGEIANSVANLALARAGRSGGPDPAVTHAGRPGGPDPAVTHAGRPGGPDPALTRAGRQAGPDTLGRLEQLLTDGHPLHPCCRTRGGMTVADVLAYAPEHRPVIRLRRLRVPAGRWYGTAEPVLYAHPWQAARLLDRYPWLADEGETGPARPLMSLRTVAPVDGGPHVKTAVDVQITSAVRTVSPAAVHNGPLLSALLGELTADLPIGVLAETASGAVIVDGAPRRHLAHLLRAAPALGAGETAVPLGAFGASPMLLSAVPDAYGFMGLLGTRLFAPLVRLLARGVALEAHGQNTLVVLRAGLPHRILYRDLGGVRVSAARLRAAGVDPPPLRGDLPSDDPHELRTKLAAAALGTVAAQLIDAFARRGADPRRMWGIVAAAIRGTGTSDAPHLLGEPLPVKATTAMRLAEDPLRDVWALVDNPLAEDA